MGYRHYRDDAEIDRTLNLLRDIWAENNFLNLAEVFHCVCKVKETDIKHLTDMQLTNYIENYLEGSNSEVHQLKCTNTRSKK